MSEAGQASVGTLLREAREAREMSVDDVAARLRLMQRQIELIEADDFDGLGRPVFARGFVRNYARLLGMDPAPLLARMEGSETEPSPVRRAEPPLPRSWLSSPWLVVLLLIGLAVVVVPVGLYWWLNQGEDAWLHEMPRGVKVEPVELGAPAPGAGAAARDAAVPAVEAPANAEAPLATTDAAPSAATDAASAPTPGAEPTEPSGPPAAGVLHFDFAGDSWVEVRDASGRAIHRQLNPAGSSIEVRGRPPFRLLVGNAAQTRMTYNGRPIDLKPFIDVTVARFTLEE
ncbi:MAG: RodZ domain-containing protein [Planctomycetota bacterium]